MITKIDKIKNLGVFRDYRDSSSLPEFKRYNLIYGLNGCGKTSLSRLFSVLNTGSIGKFPDLEYQVSTSDGVMKQGQNYSRMVRVFNQEYITENSPSLDDPGTESKHIYILGKEDKALVAQVEKDRSERERLSNLLSYDDKKNGIVSLKTRKEQLEKVNSKLFTDIARTIASSRGRAFRDYNKTDALKTYTKLERIEDLDPKDLEKCQTIIEQNVQEKLSPISLQAERTALDGAKRGQNICDEITSITKATNSLLAQTVKQNAIRRLTENSDIAEWIAQGLEIQKKHGSARCEYCDQSIPGRRIDELAGHFNDAHQTLIKKIEKLQEKIRDLTAALITLNCVDKSNPYDHLTGYYGECVRDFSRAKQEVIKSLSELEACLNDKKLNTHKPLKAVASIDFAALVSAIKQVNNIIEEHNKISDKFEETTSAAKEKLERHFVSTVFEEAKQYERESEDLKQLIKKTSDTISELEIKIRTNEATIRNSKIACEKLNRYLEQFLGRAEITFEDTENGYLIRRSGKPADNLSEGEKTAIAFVYFIISLQSSDFNLKEGVVVVDDPVSSFDSNSIFQAFAFVKNTLSDSHQLFVITHNFEFLRLMINWLDHTPHSYFMINNRYEGGNRCAFLCELDRLLQEHESEYHYLFKVLHTYKSDGEIETAYNIPNIARKVMETFLMFRVPNGGSAREKLQTLPFDETKKTAIYKFTNDQSHLTGKGFDPCLVSETQKNVSYLLEMIQTVFPEHYNILVDSIMV